jgi:hypothetical protein
LLVLLVQLMPRAISKRDFATHPRANGLSLHCVVIALHHPTEIAWNSGLVFLVWCLFFVSGNVRAQEMSLPPGAIVTDLKRDCCLSVKGQASQWRCDEHLKAQPVAKVAQLASPETQKLAWAQLSVCPSHLG